MPFDALIANPGRLRILTALAEEPRQEFVRLRGMTRLTDGNLATHARRLESAGLLAIDKRLRGGRPVTTYTLTNHGREALRAHVERLIRALHPAQALPADAAIAEPAAETAQREIPDDQEPDDNWVD